MLSLLSLHLVAVGFIVGVLSGFFGFGGGFILTPLLMNMGLPANISVGTSVTQIFISSAISSLRHKRLGNVDARMSLIIAPSSIAGAEIGAQTIEYLKMISVQHLNLLISLFYIPVLSFMSAYITYESAKSRSKKVHHRNFLLRKIISGLNLKPQITQLQVSKPVSVWIILIIGFIVGLSAGFLGISGGLILIPLLIYVIGYEPHIAAGTCALEIFLSCAFASLSHMIKGNINFLLVALILAGSLVGLQIGVSATKYVKSSIFKTSFGICLAAVSLSIIMRLLSEVFNISFLNFTSLAVVFSSALLLALLILAVMIRERRRLSKT